MLCFVQDGEKADEGDEGEKAEDGSRSDDEVNGARGLREGCARGARAARGLREGCARGARGRPCVGFRGAGFHLIACGSCCASCRRAMTARTSTVPAR